MKIEFEPWAQEIGFIGDENKDHFPEFYARLKDLNISEELLNRIISDYHEKMLSREEIKTWANELASFWYPKYNTDIAQDQMKTQWTTNETDQISSSCAVVSGLFVHHPAGESCGYKFH